MEHDGSEQPGDGSDAAGTAPNQRLQELTARILALEEERDQAEQAGDQTAQAAALRKLGDVNRAAGATSAAREAYSRARYLYQMIGNSEGSAAVLLTVGNMEARARRFEAAARSFHEACDLYKRMVVPDKLADGLLSEADSLLAAGNQLVALDRINEAASLFVELDDTLGQAHVAFRLGMISQVDEPESADVHLALAARLFGDHVSRSGEEIDVSLPNTIGDSRRYPPFVMQRVCLRERQKLSGEAPTEPMRNRATSAALLVKDAPAEASSSKESSMTTWLGVGLLFVGTLAVLVPQLVGEVEVFGDISEWISAALGSGTAVNLAVAAFGAVVAMVAAQQAGVYAPIVLLAVGLGFGLIFHEVSRTLITAGLRTSVQTESVAKSGQVDLEALSAGRAGAARALVAGRAALDAGNASEARSKFSQSFNLAKAVTDIKAQIRALEGFLDLEIAHGAPAAQIEAGERLYDALRGVDNDRGREVLEVIVSVANGLGDLQKVRDTQIRLLTYYENAGDIGGEVAALMALAAIDRDLLDFEGAYEWFRRAHAHYQTMRDAPGQVGTLLAMGEIDAKLGRRRRAYGSYYHAFAMYRESGERSGQAAMLLHMGALDEAGARYEQAIAAFRQAQRIYSGLGDEAGEALAALRFGSTQFAHGNQRQARDGFTRSLELYTSLGDVAGQARAQLGLGRHWGKLGERAKALASYEAALDLYRRSEDPRGSLAVLRETALLEQAGGGEVAARGKFEEARRVARGVADPSVRASLLLSAGDLALSLEFPDDAIPTYREALALYQAIGDDPGQRAATDRLSRLNASG